MILKSLAKLDQKAVDYFYNPLNFGVLVLRDKAISGRVVELYKNIKHKDFYLKGEQHINNGQKHYLFNLKDETIDPNLLSLFELYKPLRKPFGSYVRKTKLDFGVSLYPKGEEGEKLHKDFSYNAQVTVFMFFGSVRFKVGLDKSGGGVKWYDLLPGDILFVRGPRRDSQEERDMRPIYGFGEVKEDFCSLEVREVDERRRKVIES